MTCEFDIMKQGYLKGFVDGFNRRKPVPAGGGYHEFGGADGYRQGYTAGFKRGSGQIKSEGDIKDTVRKYFYKDFENEINAEAEMALNLQIPGKELLATEGLT